jgi:hypothetical protein
MLMARFARFAPLAVALSIGTVDLAAQIGVEKTVAIREFSRQKEDSPAHQKDYDVTVERFSLFEEWKMVYRIIVHRLVRGEMRAYGDFAIQGPEDVVYDRAAYRWVADTTVVIRLSSAPDGPGMTLELTRRRNGTAQLSVVGE